MADAKARIGHLLRTLLQIFTVFRRARAVQHPCWRGRREQSRIGNTRDLIASVGHGVDYLVNGRLDKHA